MDCARDEQQLLVFRILAILDHRRIGVLREVAGVGLVAMDQQHGAADLATVREDGLVQEGLATRHVPAAIRVQRTGMVAAGSLVVVIVVLHEERGIGRKRIDHAAGELVGTGLIVGGTLGAHGSPFPVPGLLVVLGIEIAVGVDPRHVVHGGGDRGLDAGVQRGGVQGHASPAADTDDADAPGVDGFLHRKEIHCRHEVLRVDVRRGHIARVPAALPGIGRVEGNRDPSPFRHRLRIQARALFLDRSEGTADGNGRHPAGRPLGRVHVGGKRDAVAVHEGHLPVIDLFTLGECLVPPFDQLQCFRFHHTVSSSWAAIVPTCHPLR